MNGKNKKINSTLKLKGSFFCSGSSFRRSVRHQSLEFRSRFKRFCFKTTNSRNFRRRFATSPPWRSSGSKGTLSWRTTATATSTTTAAPIPTPKLAPAASRAAVATSAATTMTSTATRPAVTLEATTSWRTRRYLTDSLVLGEGFGTTDYEINF